MMDKANYQGETNYGGKAILVFALFLSLWAAPLNLPKSPTQAQCKFSDGKTISVTYSAERVRTIKLTTDESLVTVKGITVPAGDYAVSLARDSHNKWALMMRKRTGKGESWQLPPLPMSVEMPTLPIGNFTVSFDHTGGSCMMHWDSKKLNILLSLEFTEKNADLPVTP